MKVLIIVRNLTKVFSAPHYAVKLASGLAKHGVRVLVATSNPHTYLDNVGMIKLPKFFGMRSLSPILYSAFATYAKGICGIDVVHGNGYTFGDDVTTVHSLKRGFRYYINMRCYDVPRSHDELFEDLLLKSSGHFIAPSNMIKECLIRFYGIEKERISVVHHGVDINEFKPPQHPTSI
jgi:glycosyltransferase involved in cell wall biosynthesis